MNNILALGLMSGTSADGISISSIEIFLKQKKLKVLNYKTYPYTSKLRNKILNSRNLNTCELSELNFELGKLWAEYVRRFCADNRISFKDIYVIGLHGQTVCHCPYSKIPNTLQIGEPSFIAEETGRTVVCDFRVMDMAAQGHGAPLVPFMDEYIFGGGKPKILLNIGGIANISVVGRGIKTYGFDTGPGNCLMDSAMCYITKGKMLFDKNGKLASFGKIDYSKVKNFLKMPFFSKKPPKSLDRNNFSMDFLKRHFKLKKENLPDIIATLNYLTAKSIEFSIKKFVKHTPGELVISGGGALNPVLIGNLCKLLHPIKVSCISKYGMHPLAKEPACFALLAYFCLKGKFNNCPYVTGAKGKRILGKIVRGHNNIEKVQFL